jgi:hypothetical protein
MSKVLINTKFANILIEMHAAILHDTCMHRPGIECMFELFVKIDVCATASIRVERTRVYMARSIWNCTRTRNILRKKLYSDV